MGHRHTMYCMPSFSAQVSKDLRVVYVNEIFYRTIYYAIHSLTIMMISPGPGGRYVQINCYKNSSRKKCCKQLGRLSECVCARERERERGLGSGSESIYSELYITARGQIRYNRVACYDILVSLYLYLSRSYPGTFTIHLTKPALFPALFLVGRLTPTPIRAYLSKIRKTKTGSRGRKI